MRSSAEELWKKKILKVLYIEVREGVAHTWVVKYDIRKPLFSN